MQSHEVIVYVPGAAINPSKILQVERLPSRRWGPIQEAYPEVKAAGPNASFHGKRNTTIFPPTTMSKKGLHTTASVAVADGGRTLYRWEVNGQLLGILVHVHGVRGGYDSVHIYRLAASEVKRLLAGPRQRRPFRR